MGADCGCGGECGICGPRLARESSFHVAEIMNTVKNVQQPKILPASKEEEKETNN